MRNRSLLWLSLIDLFSSSVPIASSITMFFRSVSLPVFRVGPSSRTLLLLPISPLFSLPIFSSTAITRRGRGGGATATRASTPSALLLSFVYLLISTYSLVCLLRAKVFCSHQRLWKGETQMGRILQEHLGVWEEAKDLILHRGIKKEGGFYWLLFQKWALISRSSQ